jgi:hypothetical protein
MPRQFGSGETTMAWPRRLSFGRRTRTMDLPAPQTGLGQKVAGPSMSARMRALGVRSRMLARSGVLGSIFRGCQHEAIRPPVADCYWCDIPRGLRWIGSHR